MTILKEALIALNDWVQSKEPFHPIFKVGCDVFTNLNNYVLVHGGDSITEMKNLNTLFMREGFYSARPFNKDQGDWDNEWLNDSFYQNQARCSWIKKHGTLEKVITPEVLELSEIIYNNPLGSNDKSPVKDWTIG